jgi:hypothetical protein
MRKGVAIVPWQSEGAATRKRHVNICSPHGEGQPATYFGYSGFGLDRE